MQESKNFCGNYITKFLINLDEMWSTVETDGCDEPRSPTYFISSIQYSRERTLTLFSLA